jgi:hypothetical protein
MAAVPQAQDGLTAGSRSCISQIWVGPARADSLIRQMTWWANAIYAFADQKEKEFKAKQVKDAQERGGVKL